MNLEELIGEFTKLKEAHAKLEEAYAIDVAGIASDLEEINLRLNRLEERK